MPYDDVLKDDPRPLFLGEYFFPVCHEQTDVSINPGLRELWGLGSAEPDSAFGRACAPGLRQAAAQAGHQSRAAGATSPIRTALIGGAIWASHRRRLLLLRHQPRRLRLAPRVLGAH